LRCGIFDSSNSNASYVKKNMQLTVSEKNNSKKEDKKLFKKNFLRDFLFFLFYFLSFFS
jgi:hypothetical protein